MKLYNKKKQCRSFDNEFIMNGKRIFRNCRPHVYASIILFMCSILSVEDVIAQLPDNGFRDEYNNDGYNSGSVNQGSQNILDVVKSINYLSEVRKFIWFIICIRYLIKQIQSFLTLLNIIRNSLYTLFTYTLYL